MHGVGNPHLPVMRVQLNQMMPGIGQSTSCAADDVICITSKGPPFIFRDMQFRELIVHACLHAMRYNLLVFWHCSQD